MLSMNSRSSTSHYMTSFSVTPDKGHFRKSISNILSTATIKVPSLIKYPIYTKQGSKPCYEGSKTPIMIIHMVINILKITKTSMNNITKTKKMLTVHKKGKSNQKVNENSLPKQSY